MVIYVILLNWNGHADTIECLAHLLASKGIVFVTVVCDNDSVDGSPEQFRAWASATLSADAVTFLERQDVVSGATLNEKIRVAFVSNGSNLGFAGGNNVGIRLAMNDPECRFVWLLNNDTVVAPDALAEAVSHAESDSRIGLCGSTLLYYHERDRVQAFGGARYTPTTGRSRHVGAFATLQEIPTDPSATESLLSYVVGAAMLVRREFIEQVGLMQEDYFLYYEEIDWATRGMGLFRLGYAPRSLVYHKEGASIGTSASGGSALSVYFLFRNRVRFTWRFYRRHLVTVVSSCAWDILKYALKGRIRQASAALRGMFLLSRPALAKKA